jgi:hypothetical protein
MVRSLHASLRKRPLFENSTYALTSATNGQAKNARTLAREKQREYRRVTSLEETKFTDFSLARAGKTSRFLVPMVAAARLKPGILY